ncbi:hypothetical protein [Lacipirellula parvula]|uniref:Uncharacterized protein n=1 Tax=Lacipirellula parvula TaxID=2650471 RepID=A0A5K7XQZ1_9BACT|nr:hypothetical protein [Lacipirellula parvula]BBO36199.1 hypothetical protein PLANPX_5811 [Lacipirellula parvula]
MANVMRWRYGDTNPVVLPVAALTVIEIGDLIYQSSGAALPASELADAGTEAGNQEAFHDIFVGVAMQASPSGVSNPIRVATSGVFEFDCISATAEVGDLFGSDEDGTGTELLSQVVAKVATANLAIGRCAKRVNPAASRVLIEVVSTVLRGGPQVMA